MRNNKAFGLIEFLYSTAILGVLLILTHVELLQLKERLAFNYFFEQSENKIKQLQRKAQSYNQTQILTLKDNNLEFTHNQKISKLNLPSGAKVLQPTKLPKQLSFYSGNTNQAFSLMIEGKKIRCSMIVSIRGRIRKTCNEI